MLERRLGDGPRVAEPAAVGLYSSRGDLLALELGLLRDLARGVADGVVALSAQHVDPLDRLGIAVEVLSCEWMELG